MSVSSMFLFFPGFLQIFHNTVMILAIGVMITIESQKEKKTCFNAHFQYNQPKITELK